MQNTLSFTNAKLSRWTYFFGISEIDSSEYKTSHIIKTFMTDEKK